MSKTIEKNKVATRKAGKETYKKIIQTTYELISSGSYKDFSMRNIAKHSNLRLANIQYYFPTKEDLVTALIMHVETLYDIEYQSLNLDKTEDPKVAFNKMIDFCLDDVFNQNTRHLFIQLWPLLSDLDNDSGEFLANLYRYQIQSIATLVQRLSPNVTKKESLIRGEAIASLIEGLIVVRLNSNDNSVNNKTIKAVMKRYAFTLAQTDSQESSLI
ncbi:TetR/AcrR family transcriptional regulator [Pseudocolwellia agarivorans]|uniref:TetR/AcrR family transcriptional regulator n=1 Tax=Pseudocolwellia agarivorans TaxID=1911682 RepID=UPI00158C6E22|nr:TetR/AcrR family transcriptional regulator [Pseudocolwellia agarivorans]